ncbi:hypothetical protein APTSU1_000550100 [Apodemus speciosus]|uniref:Uncharacterized protein n=1 Tax=Apodemus speciosus TaxID=105296 RepID=A0ABQ0ETC1_APOSI
MAAGEVVDMRLDRSESRTIMGNEWNPPGKIGSRPCEPEDYLDPSTQPG